MAGNRQAVRLRLADGTHHDMASVGFEGVTKVFSEGVIAVQDLDLEVQDGEMLVLFGPSGCGKTTCLRLLAGLEQPTRGHVRLGGRVMTHVPPRDRDVALVFQQAAVYPHLDVRSNLAFGLKLRYGGLLSRLWRRWSGSRASLGGTARGPGVDRRVEETAWVLGIGQLLDRMPWQLSGGERQRVALGRALVRQPAVFLFDEPISSLEEGLRVELRRRVCRVLQQLRATAIWVTHDPWEALSLGDRIAVMGGGRIHQVGSPQEVFDFPCSRFVAGVVGRPAMNFLRGELSEEGSGWRFRGCGADALIPGDRFCCPRQGLEVELGVRPDQVAVRAGRVACGLPLAANAVAAGCGVVVGDELLGDGWLVRVELDSSGEALGKVELACRVSRSMRLPRGELVTVGWAPAEVHLFGALTGESLRRLGGRLADGLGR